MTLLLIAVIFALVYLVMFCHATASWAKTLVKTASVGTLMMAALLNEAPLLLVAALALCTAGDYLLSRDSEPTFLAGVGAFAAGHIAYIALFLTTPVAQLGALATPWKTIFIAALVVYGAVMMRLLYRKAGALRIPVMGYVPIILLMGVAALTVSADGALRWVVPSAIFFMVSDSLLAAELFLLRPDHHNRRMIPYLVWSYYWVAQLGFLMAYTQF